MKKLKLLLLLIFLALFTVPAFSQITVVYDSLYFGTPGDSVAIINLGRDVSAYKIVMDTSSNSPIDSITVKNGFANQNGKILWGDYVSFKDSSFSDVNILTGPSKEFLAMSMINQYIKVEIQNNRGNLATRKIRFGVVTIKQK